MTLQFIHAYAIELEGSVSSKRPHLRGDKPGITEKKVSLLRDGIDPRYYNGPLDPRGGPNAGIPGRPD